MSVDKDELIEAQKQVIGILFEIIKRFQNNKDLDDEYLEIIASAKIKNNPRLDEILEKRKANSETINTLLEKLN